MKVFILTYTTGCSTGYKEFIGAYSTREKAEESKINEMKNPFKLDERGYKIQEIELDKTYNTIFNEW